MFVINSDVGTNPRTLALENYNNSNSFTGTIDSKRGRGTFVSPLPVQANDDILKLNSSVYGDSGNQYLSVASISSKVVTNDLAGNVSAAWQISAPGANSYVAIAAPTILFQQANNAASGNISGNGNMSLNGTVTAAYFSGNGYYLTGLNSNAIIATYGAFYNPNSISLSANTVYNLALPNVSGNNGVYIANTSQMVVPVAGTYNIQFSLQVKNTDNAADHDIDVWFAKNGTDIPASASQWTVVKNDGKNICVVNLVDTCTANSYYEIKYAASSANISLEAFSNISTPYTRPSIPSAIVTIVPVGS
jgi:hypothetical protein